MADDPKDLLPATQEDAQLEVFDPLVAEPPVKLLRGGHRKPANVQQVRDLARTFTIRALNKLVKLMEFGRDERIQLQATVELLNRSWGHAVTEIQITEPSKGDPEVLARAAALAAQTQDPEQLKGILAALQDALGIKPVIPEGYEESEKPLADRENTDPQLVTEYDQLGPKYAGSFCSEPCGHAKLEHNNGAGACDLCRCPVYTRPCSICSHPRPGHNVGFAFSCAHHDCECLGD